jgi:hypothetical protein
MASWFSASGVDARVVAFERWREVFGSAELYGPGEQSELWLGDCDVPADLSLAEIEAQLEARLEGDAA